MLKLDHVSKYYNHSCALDDLCLTVEEGALFGLVGPNGAGKTTAIRLMTGLTQPDEGSVVYDASDGHRPVVGYVPDTFGVYSGLKVREYLEFFASCSGIEGLTARHRIEELLKYVDLTAKADHYVEALSQGMKQKLSLARALLNDPDYIIMDEPTNGLDPGTRYEFRRIAGELSDNGKTIVISSHILSDLSEMCTDIAILDQGRLVLTGRLMDVLGRVTRGSEIVITAASGLTKAVSLLKADARVRALSVKSRDILISFDGSPEDEADLVKKLVEAGVPVCGFAKEKGSLETLFMRLTGGGGERVITDYDALEESDV